MALAANDIGLKTGFCKCFYPLETGTINSTSIKLKNHNISFSDLLLLMGVGYPVDKWPSNKGADGLIHEQFPKEYQASKLII